MKRPWIRALFVFVVALIGCQSVTGLVWLFLSSDKLLEILLLVGVAIPAWLAYLEHDRCTQDPMLMNREAQRKRLREFVRDERRETQRPP